MIFLPPITLKNLSYFGISFKLFGQNAAHVTSGKIQPSSTAEKILATSLTAADEAIARGER